MTALGIYLNIFVILQLMRTIQSGTVTNSADALGKLMSCVTPKAAFDVELADKNTILKGYHTVIKYTHVIENTNGDYNTDTGEFTTREPGLYLFNLHAVGGREKEARIMMVKNGKERIAGLFVQGELADSTSPNKKVEVFDNGHNAASTSAVVMLKKGDKVSVVNQNWAGELYEDNGPNGFGGNSFNGVLLRSSNCP